MSGSRQISSIAAVIGALLALAGCAKKRPAPVVPPPPAAASHVAPKPRVPSPVVQNPAPQTPPVIAPAVPVRPPMTLESRTDPVIDRASVEIRIRGVQGMLAQLNSRNLIGSGKDDRDRVASMLDVARRSLASGDVHQASDLSARAEILAKALLNAR